MATAELKVVYDDFSGGEYGTIGGRKAPSGTWTGRNMRLYRNGSLGVRPGVRDLEISGIPASGTLLGLAYVPFGSAEMWFVIDTGASVVVRMAPFSQGAASGSAGTVAAAPSNPEIIRVNESTRSLDGRIYFQVDGDKGYYTTPGSLTTTAVTDTPSGRCLELYKDRMVGGGPAARLRYSDAADFDAYDVLQFIDVGYQYPAYQMFAHRDGLSIFAQALIWRLTGTIGSTEVLRRASSALPLSPYGDAVLDGERVIYIPNGRNGPVVWDGSMADENSMAHLDWRGLQTSSTVISGGIAKKHNDILFTESNNGYALWRSSGAWSYHTWDVGYGTWGILTRAQGDKFIISGYEVGADVKFYVLDADLDRPGFANDTSARPGDDSTALLSGNFTLPEWWDPQDRQVNVRAVTVDFTKWQTGASNNNHFDLVVTSLDKYDGGAAVAATTQSFDESGASSSTSGTDCRKTFYFGEQGVGGGFKVALSDIRGIAIRDIIVTLEVDPSRSV